MYTVNFEISLVCWNAYIRVCKNCLHDSINPCIFFFSTSQNKHQITFTSVKISGFCSYFLLKFALSIKKGIFLHFWMKMFHKMFVHTYYTLH